VPFWYALQQFAEARDWLASTAPRKVTSLSLAAAWIVMFACRANDVSLTAA
jgi:hypothetical protein